MAQTNYTPILIYSSSTVSQAPAVGNLTNSTLGSELAINITDGKLFYKDNANAIQVIAWKVTPTTAGGTGLTSYTQGDLLYYNSGTALSKLAIGATGRWLGSSGSAPQWNAPAALTKTDDTNVTLTLGGSASTALLNAASITAGWTGTLATSRGGTGLSSFTANGVFYATSTAAIGQSANLTFNGTTLSTANVTASGELISTTNDARISLYRSAGINYFDWASGQTLAFGTQTSQSGAGRVNKVNFTDAGNIEIANGNLVPSTAAKGVNFTANTPLAGMTSQLLNWYEEGAYTATISPETSGSITLNASVKTLYYTRVGRVVTITGLLQVDSVSSPVGSYVSISLPTTIANNYAARVGSTAVLNQSGTYSNKVLLGVENTAAVRIYVLATTVAASDQFSLSFSYVTA